MMGDYYYSDLSRQIVDSTCIKELYGCLMLYTPNDYVRIMGVPDENQSQDQHWKFPTNITSVISCKKYFTYRPYILMANK